MKGKRHEDGVQHIISEKQREGANLLIPNITLSDPTGMYEPVLESVVLNPDPKNGPDVYNDRGKLRLTGFALEKLANVANIRWDPIQSCPITHKPGEYVLYRAVGYLLKADGEALSSVGYGEMDTTILMEDLTDEYTNKANDYKDKNDQQKKEYVEYCVNRDFRQKRRFMIPLAETKAKNRVIRKLLNVKNEYTAKELTNPFVMIWFRMKIDYSDPQIRMMAFQAKLNATASLFGRQSGQPACVPEYHQQPAIPHIEEPEPPPNVPLANNKPDKQPTTEPEKPPENGNNKDNLVEDFKKKSDQQQFNVLKYWIGKTGYNMKEAQFKLEDLSERNRLRFFETLIDLHETTN